jgi:hypothetical protein
LTGHHAFDFRAVLGDVQGRSAERRPRVDVYAASGLDVACAQLRQWHLRDGRSFYG